MPVWYGSGWSAGHSRRGVIGTAVGGSVKVLKHIGINEVFIKDIAAVLEPGNSAIFIRAHKSISEGIVDILKIIAEHFCALHCQYTINRNCLMH